MFGKWFSPPALEGETFGIAWKKQVLTWGYSWGGCLVCLMVMVDLWQDREFLALSESIYAAILFFASVVMMRTGRFFRTFAWIGMLGMMLFPNLNSFLAGGFFGSGGRGVWAFTAPMMSALLLPDWCTAVFFLGFMGLLGFSLWIPGPFEPYSGDVLPILFQFHMIGIFLTSFFVFFIFFRKMEWQNKVLHRQEVERKEVAVKSDVLNVMSHEIRTPLNAIIGLLDLVSLETLPVQTKESIATIQYASKNLLSLVTDVLDYSKLVEGRIEMERIPLDAVAIARNAVAAHRLLAQENGARFRLGFDPSTSTWVEGDPTRLAQIANNLISNAVKFSPNGVIDVDVRLLDEGMEFLVRDTGVGIAPEQMGRLFKPFSQVDATITRRFGGTGLGLSIVRGIVGNAGGRIDVHSGEGKGCEFVVWLPWKSASVPAEPPRASDLRPWHILLVDDNAVNLKVAGRLLEKIGMKVACVGSGEAAIAWLSDNFCDLVFMDLQMPGMDGYEAAIRIRRDIPWEIPIVALSAEVLDTSQTRLRECGMRGFLGKPIDIGMLKKCLLVMQEGTRERLAEESSAPPSGFQGFSLFAPGVEPA